MTPDYKVIYADIIDLKFRERRRNSNRYFQKLSCPFRISSILITACSKINHDWTKKIKNTTPIADPIY